MSPAAPCNLGSRGKKTLGGTMGSALPGVSTFLNKSFSMLSTSLAEQGLEELWIKIMRQAEEKRRCLPSASLAIQCESRQITPDLLTPTPGSLQSRWAQASTLYCSTASHCRPEALLAACAGEGEAEECHSCPTIPRQHSTDRFNLCKLVTVLVFKSLPGERKRVRNVFSTQLRRYFSIKEKIQSKIQTSSHTILLCLLSLLSDQIAGWEQTWDCPEFHYVLTHSTVEISCCFHTIL